VIREARVASAESQAAFNKVRNELRDAATLLADIVNERLEVGDSADDLVRVFAEKSLVDFEIREGRLNVEERALHQIAGKRVSIQQHFAEKRPIQG
jgi:hypothetical protein